MLEGVATTHTGGTSLGRNCSTAHPSRTSPHGSVHSHLAGDVHASVRASGIEKKGSCPTTGAKSAMLVGRDRSFRNWSVYQDRVRDGSVLMDQRWLQWVNKVLPRLKEGNPEERICSFDYPAAAKMLKTATDSLEVSGKTMYQTRHSGASIDRVRGLRTLQQVQKRGQWGGRGGGFSSVARYDKSSRLAADYHSLLLTLRNKLETLARRAKELLIGRLRIHQLTIG